MNCIEIHLCGFILGYILDLIIGDPYWLPHPVRAIGKAILAYENILIGKKSEEKVLSEKKKRFRGKVIVLLVVVTFLVPVSLVLSVAYMLKDKVHFMIPVIIEGVLTFQLLATKCLKVESMKVYDELKKGDVDSARKAVSMIVGRDTENLNDVEITKAAVETVAENTSDGIIAPMLFLAIGGPVLGYFYKCINTMDSMIGYKNERYMDFGRCAAKFDDFVNFIPARISAFLMIFSCLFLGKKYSAKNAARIYFRDRYKHESPNAGHTESVCAGALGVRLAGPAVYNGIVEKKDFLGDDFRVIEYEDIKRANRLLYADSLICFFLCSFAVLLFDVLRSGF